MKHPLINFRKTAAFCGALFVLSFAHGQQAHAADGGPVKITAELSHPYVLSGESQRVYLKVALRGAKPDAGKQRPSVNLALVLDKSGSMSGQKIEDVKQAARMILDRLQPTDTLSIIVYDNEARVLVPATRIENRDAIRQKIDFITADGGTALHAGLMSGAEQVRQYVSDHQANRVILLSDGMANIGPQTPHELGAVGLDLIRQGISVSTIGLGLGYNEDLMSTLAAKSDGFHQFLNNSEDLYATLDWEMGKMTSIVANNVTVSLKFADGIRPVNVGREGVISGQDVTVNINQVFGDHEIYVLTEAEIMPNFSGQLIAPVADVRVNYFDIAAKAGADFAQAVSANVTADRVLASSKLNRDVMIAANEQNAAAIQKAAMDLRDQGKVQEAKSLLEEMADTLAKAGELLASPRLTNYSDILDQSAETIENDAAWNENRKDNAATMYSVSFNVT